MSDDRMPPYDETEDALGAAPTLSAKAERPKRRRARLRLPFRGVVVLVFLALLLPAGVPALASAFKKTPRDMIGISYGGGPFEGARFQRVVDPGSGLFFNGLSDPLYLYPADQLNYIISSVADEGATEGRDSVIAPSRDRVPIEYQLAVYYRLNLDRVREFHEELGLRYEAYTSDGWRTLIQDTFRQQIENAFQEETRRYDVADIYANVETLTTVQREVQESLRDRLVDALGTEYFCGPTFRPGQPCDEPQLVIKRIDVPETVVEAYQENRTSEVAVQTQVNVVAQREAEARAIAALNTALQQAGMNYVLLRAIESGKINFWVLPSDSGVTLQTPSGSTGGAPAAPGTAR